MLTSRQPASQAAPTAGHPQGARSIVRASFVSALGRAATTSLYDELALAPKPGLVSFVDSGSHSDMNAATFLRSLFALRHYFPEAAALGGECADFARLEAAGVRAEARMMSATNGVNTHRGAIFTLGLLCAAAGAAAQEGLPCTPALLREIMSQRWGAALASRTSRSNLSNGSIAARKHRLRAAGDEAALGMPSLFEHVAPALRSARAAGASDQCAKLHAFFTAMAVLDDTNLAHRGGLQGLRGVQACARTFLHAGGGLQADAVEAARDLHGHFVARRLSPGGAADLLAAACWLERADRLGGRDGRGDGALAS